MFNFTEEEVYKLMIKRTVFNHEKKEASLLLSERDFFLPGKNCFGSREFSRDLVLYGIKQGATHWKIKERKGEPVYIRNGELNNPQKYLVTIQFFAKTNYDFMIKKYNELNLFVP